MSPHIENITSFEFDRGEVIIDVRSPSEFNDDHVSGAINLPVLSDDKRLVGIIALQDVKAHLTAGEELRAVIALDLMRPVETMLTPNARLMDALPTLMGSEMEMIPVVNSVREMRLVGSVSRSKTLGLLSDAIGQSSQENQI